MTDGEYRLPLTTRRDGIFAAPISPPFRPCSFSRHIYRADKLWKVYIVYNPWFISHLSIVKLRDGVEQLCPAYIVARKLCSR